MRPKTFVEKFIDTIDVSDLDLEYPHYSPSYNEGDDAIRNDVMIPWDKLDFVEAPSMDINDVLEVLNNLKEKGANRIYIADHGDHHGYYFYGVNLMEI